MIFRLAFLLLINVYLQPSYAQQRQYDILHYDTENGLPQNTVSGIQFDRKGYCWLGTQMGLVRFDGLRFTVFGSDNIKELRSDRILSVARDTAGVVFIRTGGISQALKINDGPSRAASIPVLLNAPGPDIPTQGFAAAHTYLSTIKHHPTFQRTFGTSSGELYVVQPVGSFYITPGGEMALSFKGPYDVAQVLFVGQSLLALEGPGKVGIWTKGVKQRYPALHGSLWINPDFIKGNFKTPVSTGDAYIYAGSSLYKLFFSNDTLYSEEILNGVKIPDVSCVYNDKPNKRIYIGSAVSGLYIISPTNFYSPPAPANAFSSPAFYSQAVTEDGILSQRFLFRKDGSRKEYPIAATFKAICYRTENKSLYYAPGLALQRLDLATGKTYILGPLSTALSSIFPDPLKSEDLIFSTSNSIGRIVHDTLSGEKKISGLTEDQSLFAAYPAGTDTFLLATWSGVKWYDYRHNKIYKSILDTLIIRQLYAESRERIWIASYGKGWYFYHKGRIVQMPYGPLEALKTVNAIIDDRRGYFWLSSNNGLFKVSKQALINYSCNQSEPVYFYTFNTRDHLPTSEFNACNPSYVWLADSMLSLPSIKGLVWFYPHKIHLSLPDKGVYIDHIRTNQTDIFQTTDGLDLAPDHGRVVLTVSSPYFGNKENMKLQFRIEGLDDEWHPIAENGEIIMDRMPAGSYSLVVRKITGMGHGQYASLMLPIQVRPYWHHTRLFYLFMLVLSLALVYWIIKLRTRILKVRNLKLETQVAFQTRDLNRMVTQLTQSEEALQRSNQTKDNIITTVLHDLRSPIRFIYSISKHIATDHKKIKQETLDAHLQELKNSMASLNSFTDQFFTWALSQHGNFSAKYSIQALDDIFLETESLYADITGANGNRLTVVPTRLHCYTDPQLLSAVIRNLLDNANKNTSKGNITLKAARLGQELLITVSDTGKGFTPEALAAFMNKNKADARSGRGSFIILYLLELIGGKLEVVSTSGKGTTLRVILHHQDLNHESMQDGLAL